MNMLLISSEKYGEILTAGEALEFGGMMVLLGMVAIFAVLGIIWAILTLFKSVFGSINAKEKPAKVKAEPTFAPAPVYAAQDAEIVAVIAAAIAMAESESGNGAKFRVVSFRRK
ncbi:MAG: hypothetical protein E7612_00860 [Ruminococcaceae bacterium]|nr:hypothetical protein [Oscillospiraceae bacterium]